MTYHGAHECACERADGPSLTQREAVMVAINRDCASRWEKKKKVNEKSE